ncbi:two component system sensor histidine kinase [Flavobacterium enshiense DK69]|uniref:sensor histidine kinase n=1 Tax=Flavobacterium enshiense TaxID=1341165 RepID=UPI0003C5F987|nr:ATP-binding protein [Flavobacterium enshiense]ESU24748.1 two component system sensor histidine kinase [Flavobacterium enshiense DK69]
MKTLIQHIRTKNQYVLSIVSVSIVSLLFLFTREYLDYNVIGYLLLVLVSLLAIFLDIYAVLLAAVLSALAMDFLFIKPYYTLHIETAKDGLLLFLFFIIAMINAVLTFKVRKANQLAHAKEAKLQTMKLYNTLLDSLSHELRTPISTIMGAIGILQEKPKQLSEENSTKLLSEMEKASLRLNHQVENLLNMSRLETGYIQPKMDWCDLKELVYKVLNDLKEELVNHRIIVKIPDYLPLFKLDYGLTEQIVYNLIYNASQYTPQGALIEIGVDYIPDVNFEYEEGKVMTCKITISDDGNGFPEDEIHKVFDKFYRLQHSKTGGTGLGLSIVKGFVEAQNGEVSLENKEDESGAIFTVAFPAVVMQTNSIHNDE